MSRKARHAQIEQRRRLVAANLLAGLTYREIAEAIRMTDAEGKEVSISIATVHGDVKVLLKRWRDESLDDITKKKQLEERRIDVALNAIWSKVVAGELDAVNTFRGLSQDRRKMFGWDAPTKIAATDPSGEKPAMSDDERLARLAGLIGATTPTPEETADAGAAPSAG